MPNPETPDKATRRPTNYDIARDWNNGFAASFTQPRLLSESDDWLAGWDSGYGFRKAKNEKLNEYMVSIGRKPFSVVRPA